GRRARSPTARWSWSTSSPRKCVLFQKKTVQAGRTFEDLRENMMRVTYLDLDFDSLIYIFFAEQYII
ncbi:unnamed protein product, partial [Amoebophrya sp. A120]